ncbi:Non-reducing end beta-L-arabinofuranosidase [Fusarium oxysporum f. sp. albedinis]|nr:Non-reducing end beta-L-arabinofuranosidase [Fusarium oxysporum f. sp. albedinis]
MLSLQALQPTSGSYEVLSRHLKKSHSQEISRTGTKGKQWFRAAAQVHTKHRLASHYGYTTVDHRRSVVNIIRVTT